MIRRISGYLAAAILFLFFGLVGARIVPQAEAQFAEQGTFGTEATGAAANAQSINLPNVIALQNIRAVDISFFVGSGLTNTGPTTLVVNGINTGSPANIDRMNGGGLIPLAGGEMPAGKLVKLTYDGIEFILLTNYAAGTPSGQVAYFDQSNCPPGWSAANGSGSTVNVVGQFIRSLNTGGSGYDSGRTLASAQADGVGPLGWSGTASTTITFNPSPNAAAWSATGGQTFQTAGGSPIAPGNNPFQLTSSMWTAATTVTGNTTGNIGETRPQNVALLACQAK